MSENIGKTSDEQGRRDAVAGAISRLRAEEQTKGLETYVMDRSGTSYQQLLLGFDETFKYLKKLGSNVVLDIGAGTTHSAADLKREYAWLGLDFQATTLSLGLLSEDLQDGMQTRMLQYHPTKKGEGGEENPKTYADVYIGEKKRHITSAEVLHGIDDNSIACVLSLHSIAYSNAPDLAIGSIDRVLVPGGVFKGFFPIKKPYNKVDGSPALEFIKELIKRGYDVQTSVALHYRGSVVISAIKPGGPKGVKAGELFYNDRVKLLGDVGALAFIDRTVDSSGDRIKIIKHK